MSDLIKRENAIEVVCELVPIRDDAVEIADALRALPSADRLQEWIPCSERLPEDDREVLVQLAWRIEIGWHLNGIWKSEYVNEYDDEDVLAWMPLPKPWKGADDE